jgi:biopolymer transport protein ExbD/biopolymer transport protein TolR
MGMSGGGGSGDFNSEINVTPMVDIMLVLLIIFMVVTPMLQHGVTVNLPKDLNNPEEDQRIVKDTSVVISIPNDGEYYIGKDKISKELLKDKVEKMLDLIKKEEDKIVYIKSGTGVSYGDVVTVINEVRALGIDKIGLVADKKKGGGGAPAAPAPAQPAA